MPHKYLNLAAALGAPLTTTRQGDKRLDWTKVAFPAIVAFLVGTVAYAINDSLRQGATDTALKSVTLAIEDINHTVSTTRDVLVRLDTTLSTLTLLPEKVNSLTTEVRVMEAKEDRRHGAE